MALSQHYVGLCLMRLQISIALLARDCVSMLVSGVAVGSRGRGTPGWQGLLRCGTRRVVKFMTLRY
ncbi:hypothetical protein M758_UG299000 [Ceratodon purpureus]|nr:hypothetical protein M758_UG299000 [Ceratodon purpureus]